MPPPGPAAPSPGPAAAARGAGGLPAGKPRHGRCAPGAVPAGLERCAPARRGGPGLAARSRARPPCGERGGAGPRQAAAGGAGRPSPAGAEALRWRRDCFPPPRCRAGRPAVQAARQGLGHRKNARASEKTNKQTNRKEQSRGRRTVKLHPPGLQYARKEIRGAPAARGSPWAALCRPRAVPCGRCPFPGARRAAAGRALAAFAAELGVCLRGSCCCLCPHSAAGGARAPAPPFPRGRARSAPPVLTGPLSCQELAGPRPAGAPPEPRSRCRSRSGGSGARHKSRVSVRFRAPLPPEPTPSPASGSWGRPALPEDPTAASRAGRCKRRPWSSRGEGREKPLPRGHSRGGRGAAPGGNGQRRGKGLKVKLVK